MASISHSYLDRVTIHLTDSLTSRFCLHDGIIVASLTAMRSLATMTNQETEDISRLKDSSPQSHEHLKDRTLVGDGEERERKKKGFYVSLERMILRQTSPSLSLSLSGFLC